MYRVIVTNKYPDAIQAFGGIINKNDTRPVKSNPLGTGWINIPGIGHMNFNDIGKDHAGGFSKATWGVLISYQGEETEFRYEGEGEINVTINRFGQAELSGNGGFSRVDLPSFKFV
ncbi:MAG: hypothetical protein ICV60_13885 [Pyrinomonadaceae bacterium]|nr:hypothetical protein [Pyrinomonadaceae bacterium]